MISDFDQMFPLKPYKNLEQQKKLIAARNGYGYITVLKEFLIKGTIIYCEMNTECLH